MNKINDELKITKAIDAILMKAKEEYGEDIEFEEDDIFYGIFEDGVITIEVDYEGTLNIDTVIGTPYIFNYALGFDKEE